MAVAKQQKARRDSRRTNFVDNAALAYIQRRTWLRALVATILMAVWVIVMALIFQATEADTELSSRTAAVAAFDEAVAKRSATLRGLRVRLGGDAEALANLTKLENELDELDGSRPHDRVRDWTFVGSVYYSYTLVTTIGYGTFAPATDAG